MPAPFLLPPPLRWHLPVQPVLILHVRCAVRPLCPSAARFPLPLRPPHPGTAPAFPQRLAPLRRFRSPSGPPRLAYRCCPPLLALFPSLPFHACRHRARLLPRSRGARLLPRSLVLPAALPSLNAGFAQTHPPPRLPAHQHSTSVVAAADPPGSSDPPLPCPLCLMYNLMPVVQLVPSPAALPLF
ncbi:hypothetical protein B0H14DRAFT_3470634 [Mycena olivaceomarginata]|nr:hypothetical protein B0H14DRAFT_3470634 [Mycena olivaceomarginata]